MKDSDLLLVGLLGLGAWLVMKRTPPPSAQPAQYQYARPAFQDSLASIPCPQRQGAAVVQTPRDELLPALETAAGAIGSIAVTMPWMLPIALGTGQLAPYLDPLAPHLQRIFGGTTAEERGDTNAYDPTTNSIYIKGGDGKCYDLSRRPRACP